MRACHLMLGNQGLCLLDLFLKLELKENVLQHMLKNAMIERKKFRIATLCYSLMWWNVNLEVCHVVSLVLKLRVP
jgi:hypothetical protein